MSTPIPPPPPPGGPPPPGEPPPHQPVPAPTAEQRNWAMATHLSALVVFVGLPSLLGPLIVWLLKREDHPFIDAHGKEALNFNLSVTIYVLAGGVLISLGAILTLGLGLLLVIPVVLAAAVAWLIITIIAGVRASNGETYRYPLTIRFVT